jgi:hypothetical protein
MSIYLNKQTHDKYRDEIAKLSKQFIQENSNHTHINSNRASILVNTDIVIIIRDRNPVQVLHNNIDIGTASFIWKDKTDVSFPISELEKFKEIRNRYSDFRLTISSTHFDHVFYEKVIIQDLNGKEIIDLSKKLEMFGYISKPGKDSHPPSNTFMIDEWKRDDILMKACIERKLQNNPQMCYA